MAVRGGDIKQVKIKGRELDVASETNMNYYLSGYNSETKPTGNGKSSTTLKRKLGGFDGLVLSLDDTNQDLEFLQEIWDNGESVSVVITLATGKTYSGTLAGEGDLKKDASNGQCPISMLGEKFEQI